MDWETWVHGPGLPPVELDFRTKELNESKELADEYIKLGGKSSPSNYKDYNNWFSSLKVVFLEQLVANQENFNPDLLKKIDEDLNITSTRDPEVMQRWFPLGITKGYDVVKPYAHTHISSMGRMKYLQPIYEALVASN